MAEIAARTGKNSAEVVEQAVDRLLDYEERFLEAVEKGRASAQKGDLLEHEAVVERIEQIFRS